MVGYAVWYMIWGHRPGQREQRRQDLEWSTPGSLVQDDTTIELSAIRLASETRDPSSSLPVSTSVIHLAGSDQMTDQWLRAVIHHSVRESSVVIPGFLHTPIAMNIHVTASTEDEPRYTIFLNSVQSSEIDSIWIDVVVSNEHYQINQLRFDGANISLTVERRAEVVGPQPPALNPDNAPGASGILVPSIPPHEQLPQPLFDQGELPQIPPPAYETVFGATSAGKR